MDFEIDIPESWRKCRIRDVGDVVTGRTPSTKREEFYGGDYNLISPADLDGRKYVFTAHKRLTHLGFRECRTLPRDTVLVGCIGNVGKLGMVFDEKSATNQQINAVICNQNNDPHFIYYCLHSNRSKLEQVADKTTLPILNKTNFENFEIAVPSLPQQRKIAGVLGVVQRAIEQQERQLQLTAELKKTLLHQLFTQGLRGEPQKQTEIGSVPESWGVVKLRDLCDLIVDCPHTTPIFQTEGIRVARNFNIRDGRFVTSPAFYTSEEEYQQRIKRAEPLSGDILFSREAPVGEACVIPDGMKLSLGQRTMLLRATEEKLDAQFMVYCFYAPHVRLRMLASSSGLTVPHLNVADVRALLVPIPPLCDQQQIATAILTVDNTGECHRKKHAALADLFRALLHQLMTAQIRVHDLDLSVLGTIGLGGENSDWK